jgi:hypothetical protein
MSLGEQAKGRDHVEPRPSRLRDSGAALLSRGQSATAISASPPAPTTARNVTLGVVPTGLRPDEGGRTPLPPTPPSRDRGGPSASVGLGTIIRCEGGSAAQRGPYQAELPDV